MLQEEPIIIKRSTEANKESSLGCLLIVAIPVVCFLYAMLTTRRTHDAVAYGIIAVFFLLLPFIEFIVTKIPLKAAMTISKDGIVLSPSKGIYDSFAFLQKIRPARKELLWENITRFELVIYNGSYTACPTDGTGPTTHTIPEHQLCVADKTNKTEVVFSIHGLDKTSDEILALCNQFLKEFHLFNKPDFI